MLASGRQVRLVAGNAGIGRRPLGPADDEREGVQNCWIHRCVPGGGYCLRWGACKALVDVQRHAPMLGRRKQCIGKIFLLVLLEKGGGDPCRLVAVQDLTRLPQIARPEHIGFGGAWAVIAKQYSRDFLERFTGTKLTS